MNPSPSIPFPAQARTASPADAAEDPPHGDLVTVTRVFNSLEAEMLRGCLQAEGIPATLGDAQMIQTDSLLAGALGGIRVMVPACFEVEARRAVGAFERGEFSIDELPAGEEPAAAEPDAASQLGMPRLTWLAIVLLAVAGVIVALARPNSLTH